MSKASLQVSAAATNRSLMQESASRGLRGEPTLLYWRRQIELATHEAKKTRNGFPTGLAILARWWISDFRPKESQKDDWQGSFDCCCHWLGDDADVERKKLVAEIEAAWAKSRDQHWQKTLYQQRVAVLTCAGERIAIGRQFVLGLVDPGEYEDIAGIDEVDPEGWALKLSAAETE